MKSILFLLSLTFLTSTFAQEAEIYSIEEQDAEEIPNYVEASEEALPTDYYQDLEREFDLGRFTSISSARANQLFAMFTKDRRARMSSPRGACATRRAYIQRVLRGKGINSGRLLIYCPGNNGRLRVRDQVSGRYYTYSNFHDVNVVLVGNSYRIMDVQFKSSPVSLGSYLGQIEIYQRLKPGLAGTCYWKIN